MFTAKHIMTMQIEMPFGRHKGKMISEIPSAYLMMMLDTKSFLDFPLLLGAAEAELEWRDNQDEHF